MFHFPSLIDQILLPGIQVYTVHCAFMTVFVASIVDRSITSFHSLYRYIPQSLLLPLSISTPAGDIARTEKEKML
ncbi:hypothetical protein WN48_02542 [Eufriesea mexicana]|uniref:Uncharacterized protein n=1 Tax=Eufriesea mexicana TaxID=516756 RepID=A0A310SD44_9HYME|nr:hypothetical protein WN48_02542 [Eufriesea mexicana]